MSLVHPRPRQRDSRSFPAIPASGGTGRARSPSPMGRRSGGACRKMVVWCLFAGPLVSEPARLLWEKVDISQVPRSPKGSQNCRRGNDPRPITSDTNCGLRLWEGFGRFRDAATTKPLGFDDRLGVQHTYTKRKRTMKESLMHPIPSGC